MTKNAGRRKPLGLTEDERSTLERLARRPKSSQRLALRCRIVLLDDQGWTYKRIGEELGVRPQTVLKWRKRFLVKRLDALYDAPRPGVPRSITEELVETVIVKTLEEKPVGATHWSTRSMAEATGISRSSVHRIWKSFGLQPHRGNIQTLDGRAVHQKVAGHRGMCT